LTVLRPSVPGASQRVIPSYEVLGSRSFDPDLPTHMMFTGGYEKGRSRFFKQPYHVLGVKGLCFPRVEKLVVRGVVVDLFVMFYGRETRESYGIEIPFRIGSMRVAKVSALCRDNGDDGPS
jgi:hypothetical protein